MKTREEMIATPIRLLGFTHDTGITQDKDDPYKFYRGAAAVSLDVEIGGVKVKLHVHHEDVFKALDALEGTSHAEHQVERP